MIGKEPLNYHRQIILGSIIALHVAFLLREAHAQLMPPLPPSSNDMQGKPDPSRAIIFAVVLSIFFFLGFLSVYLRNCSGYDSRSSGRYLRRDADWSRRSGLDDSVVESFPVFAYSSVKDWKIGSDALECAVCLIEFEENAMLRLIPRCNHVFHIDCIDVWLYSHATCPVCRAKLVPEPEKLGQDYPPATESIAETSGPKSSTEIDRGRNHIVIDIEGDRTGDSGAIDAVMKREKRTRSGISRKLPRSNSTGHSLAQPRDNTERYTLRLTDDVRKRIMAAASGRKLKRTRSYDGVYAVAEGSTRRGYRSGGEGSSGKGRCYTVGSGQLDRPMGFIHLKDGRR